MFDFSKNTMETWVKDVLEDNALEFKWSGNQGTGMNRVEFSSSNSRGYIVCPAYAISSTMKHQEALGRKIEGVCPL